LLALQGLIGERVKEMLPMVTCVFEMTSLEIFALGFKQDGEKLCPGIG
jgi:hypothetical protein